MNPATRERQRGMMIVGGVIRAGGHGQMTADGIRTLGMLTGVHTPLGGGRNHKDYVAQRKLLAYANEGVIISQAMLQL